jgi:hypothetical protein
VNRNGAPNAERKKRVSKLDIHKATIDRLLTEGVWNDVVILREIQAEGYSCGITLIREYVHPKQALPVKRYDTAYLEVRQVGWDGYADVNGNRYSVLAGLSGQMVTVRIGLEGMLRIYRGENLVASHLL